MYGGVQFSSYKPPAAPKDKKDKLNTRAMGVHAMLQPPPPEAAAAPTPASPPASIRSTETDGSSLSGKSKRGRFSLKVSESTRSKVAKFGSSALEALSGIPSDDPPPIRKPSLPLSPPTSPPLSVAEEPPKERTRPLTPVDLTEGPEPVEEEPVVSPAPTPPAPAPFELVAPAANAEAEKELKLLRRRLAAETEKRARAEERICELELDLDVLKDALEAAGADTTAADEAAAALAEESARREEAEEQVALLAADNEQLRETYGGLADENARLVEREEQLSCEVSSLQAGMADLQEQAATDSQSFRDGLAELERQLRDETVLRTQAEARRDANETALRAERAARTLAQSQVQQLTRERDNLLGMPGMGHGDDVVGEGLPVYTEVDEDGDEQ
ncbi:hypothetical protein JCM8097_007236 [Rhodosporidiobolus ruineniae]